MVDCTALDNQKVLPERKADMHGGRGKAADGEAGGILPLFPPFLSFYPLHSPSRDPH
jgi:hypothetical protein